MDTGAAVCNDLSLASVLDSCAVRGNQQLREEPHTWYSMHFGWHNIYACYVVVQATCQWNFLVDIFTQMASQEIPHTRSSQK